MNKPQQGECITFVSDEPFDAPYGETPRVMITLSNDIQSRGGTVVYYSLNPGHRGADASQHTTPAPDAPYPEVFSSEQCFLAKNRSDTLIIKTSQTRPPKPSISISAVCV